MNRTGLNAGAKKVNLLSHLLVGALLMLLASYAGAQMTPSDDAYTLTSSPTKNFGTAKSLAVESTGATAFIRFDLSSIPSSVTGSMVAKGTLKIFVDTVPTAGSFNVDLVTSTWTEENITANNTPTLGSAIASAIPITTSDKDQYIIVDVTPAVVDWLNGTANDGLALVPDGKVSFTLDTKEATTTSHPAELDIVLTGPPGPQGPPGPISGVTAGPGLTGGGTKGNVTVSMLTSCTKNQVLQWNGSTWACSNAGTGTVTGVTAGTDLTGGGTGGSVTLNLDTTKVPQLAASNTFNGNQTFDANGGTVLTVTQNATSGTSYGITATSQANTDGSAAIFGQVVGFPAAALYGVQGNIFNGHGTGGAGVFGSNGGTSVTGSTYGGGGSGVWGDAGETGFAAGVVATADSTTALLAYNNEPAVGATVSVNLSGSNSAPGIVGVSASPVGIGVFGRNNLVSQTWAQNEAIVATGVNGDSNLLGGIGVWGTADQGYAVYGLNNGSYVTGLFLNNGSSLSYALEAGTLSKHCLVDTSGDLSCSGTVTGVVKGQGDRSVSLYAVQSPENWFEDFGSATLSNGSAAVQLDPSFAATVNTGADYHVFPVPDGDCRGLYVAEKTTAGFVVRELGGGTSNVPFEYRIIARRKGYENVRLEDVTEKQAQLAAENQQLARTNDPATREQFERRMHARPNAAAPTSGIRPEGHSIATHPKH
jgi:hypothetical protein